MLFLLFSAGNQQQTPVHPLASRGFRGGGECILQEKNSKQPATIAPTRGVDCLILPQYGGFCVVGSDSELQSDRARDGSDVLAVEASEALAKTELTDRGELVGHRFTLLVVPRDVGTRGADAADIAGERHDLHAARFAVGRVVADDDGRLPGARRMSRSCTEGGGMRACVLLFRSALAPLYVFCMY